MTRGAAGARREAASSGGVFLLEIGTEEIPARMIDGALADLARALDEDLRAASLLEGEGAIETFGTPRRLAARIGGVRRVQPDSVQEVAGPPVNAAFDASGKPTRAAEGFARAQGVQVADLARVATPRGECVAVRRAVKGLAAAEVLARRVPGVVLSMTFPKMMRWGSGEHRFVRPIHWIVALLDEAVVDMTIAGVRSGRTTRGHRQAGASPIPLRSPADYAGTLERHLVIASVPARRAAIDRLLREAAAACEATLAAPPGAGPGVAGDQELLDEVTHMVEWPSVVTGAFDEAFLDLPAEILVTAMRHHQKSFALRRRDGRLLDRFLAVANVRDDRHGTVRRGQEWVLRARLADARFFHEEDRRKPLAAHAATLERVSFHEKLGSFALKTARVERLVGVLLPAAAAAGLRVDGGVAEAARLGKADLATSMVKEFPELEGIVGGLYARADGLDAATADAIREHYLPRGADDPLPASPGGAVLSLADRLDTQSGIFLLGITPSGSRDPYALRRSVQGTIRILVEKRISVSLSRLIDAALEGYAGQAVADAVPRDQARSALLDFYRGRMQHLGEEASLRADSVRAALQAGADDPFDARLRMAALDAARRGADFEALALAHKRIKNILAGQRPGRLDPAVLAEEAEVALHRAVAAALPAIASAQAGRDHGAALRAIAGLGPALDRFFAEVMVMAEEARRREARLALLHDIAGLFLRVADFSELEPGRAAEEGGRPAASPRAGGRA